MPRIGLVRTAALLLTASLVLAVGAAAPAAADASPRQAAKKGGEKRAGHKKAGRAAQRKRLRQAARRRARVKRRLALQRRNRRHGISPQIALTGRQPTQQESEILFRGDFEAGFEDWHLQAISNRASVLSDGSFQGSNAARFEVQDGDVEPETGSERSEVSGPTFTEGQDIYIRDAIRIAPESSYEGPWQIVQQLHETDWSGSPGLAVFLDEDDVLSLAAGDGSAAYWESDSLERGRWHDLVYRVFLAQDPGAGFVEVWLDGVQQTLDNGEQRAYGQTIQAPGTYLKAGIYRSKSSTGTSMVEHDGIVVGTSLAAVLAG